MCEEEEEEECDTVPRAAATPLGTSNGCRPWEMNAGGLVGAKTEGGSEYGPYPGDSIIS